MKIALSCNIVRDMLPLYAEKLTSEESNIAIQQHLEQCEDCRKYLENIQMPIDCPTAPKAEIDYMKKVKRSYKRRTYILAGVIAVICIVVFGIFLRFFIIGSPVFMDDAYINVKWSYDADSKTYSVHGNIAHVDTGVRIKIYEDRQNNQIKIKIYEIIPSLFYPTNEFSANIIWDGEKDIVWQGKNNQQVIMSTSVLNLYIVEFKDGQYQEVLRAFDMDGVKMIQRLYDDSSKVSDTILDYPFDESQYDNYMNIFLPTVSGTLATWVTDINDLQDEVVDERIFLYQENGQHYFYLQGQPLRKVSTESVNILLDYISQHQMSQ